MPTPKFVTFTGLDDRTDLDRVSALSKSYPIEWGVLVGGKVGSNRYPKLKRFLSLELRLALHLCGTYAQSAFYAFPAHSHGWTEDDKALKLAKEKAFSRIQVNSGKYDIDALVRFQKGVEKSVIMQSRGKAFPKPLDGVSCLHDLSGGKGKVPPFRPVQAPLAPLVGYAGGIGPDNVIQVLSEIDAHTFWIDMETKIRNDDDWLDLDKCESVCKQIWG